MKQVTIILTCYKQERFIEETILSVINQNFKNRELLIWDDSPDDNCRKIISKYVNKYPEKIKAWHHKPNKWIVNNMQFLLEQRNKKSEYIAFLEWDDCLLPEYLDIKLKIFKDYPDIKLVYNELTTINSKWDVITKRHLKNFTKWFCSKWKISYEKLMDETFYMSWSSLMVKSNIVEKYQICPPFLWNKTTISDIFFFNQIAHNEDIYWISKPLILYRLHDDSTSWTIKGWISLNFELIEYTKYLYEKKHISSKLYKKLSNKWFLMISVLALRKSISINSLLTITNFSKECINKITREIKKRFQ